MMPGMIMLWNGSIETIPSGWTLCDGSMGTPDLRSKFVLGAHAAVPPDSTGGDLLHTHTFTGDGHTHDIPVSVGCPGAGPNPCIDGNETSEDPAIGTTNSGTSLPPYHALCYIMKL